MLLAPRHVPVKGAISSNDKVLKVRCRSLTAQAPVAVRRALALTNNLRMTIQRSVISRRALPLLEGVGAQSAPEPPSGLGASVSGTTVTLLWAPSAIGGPAQAPSPIRCTATAW